VVTVVQISWREARHPGPVPLRGNGAGGFSAVSQLTHVFDLVRGPCSRPVASTAGGPDILAVGNEGCLFNQHGDGHGAFAPPSRGSSAALGKHAHRLRPGDFSGDGKPDIMAVKPDGGLFLYRATSMATCRQVRNRQRLGWFPHVFSTVTSAGTGE